MTSAICFTVVLLVLLDTAIRKKDILSPFRIYLFFHGLALGIAFLGLHRAMTPFFLTTQVVYYGSGLAFLLGTLFPPLIKETLVPGAETAKPLDSVSYNWRLHLIISCLVVGFYLSGILIALKGTGVMPAFAKNVGLAIHNFMTYSFLSNLGIAACAIALALLFIAVVSAGKKSPIKKTAIALTVLVLGIHSLTFSRSSMMFFFFFALVYFHYAVRKIPILKLASILLVVFSLFATVAFVKTRSLTAQYGLKDLSTAKLVKLVFIFPYLYFANNFWNLDYGINGENYRERYKPTYGFTTVSGLYNVLTTGGALWGPDLRESYGWEDISHSQTQKVKGLNTVGYQWGLYKDFGMAGTLILPFLFGWWIALLYRRVRLYPTIINIAVYSFLAYVIAFSWFLAFWESEVYVYSFLLLIFVTFVCKYSGARGADGSAPVPAARGAV